MKNEYTYEIGDVLQPGIQGILQLASALRNEKAFIAKGFYWNFNKFLVNKSVMGYLIGVTPDDYNDPDRSVAMAHEAIQAGCHTMGCACGLAHMLWPKQVRHASADETVDALYPNGPYENMTLLHDIFVPSLADNDEKTERYGKCMHEVTAVDVAKQLEKGVEDGIFT